MPTPDALKIFLASSMSLEERDEFPKLALEIGKITGLRIEPVLCDYDAPSGDYGGKRFQDHFNGLLESCDLALVIFYSKAAEFTLEEMRLARKTCRKTFVYFKTGFRPRNATEASDLEKVFGVKDALADGNDLIYKEFETLAEFRDKFKTDFLLFLKEQNIGHPLAENALPHRLFSTQLWDKIFFTGRVKELAEMDAALAAPGSFLALTGAGGYGKTSLATQHFLRTRERHAHVAWVFCGSGIRQAMLSENTLQELFFDENDLKLPDDARWKILLERLAAAVPGQPLLVLDNADGIGEKDADDFRAALELRRELPRWSILATLRLAKNTLPPEKFPCLRVGKLNDDDARALFLENCPAAAHDAPERLAELFHAVGGHALLVELLAKNYQKVLDDDTPGYDLAAFCRDLQQNGILDLSKKRSVEVAWHDAEGRLDDILDGLYDFNQLDEEQKNLLLLLALLPARPVRVGHLRRLFGVEEGEDAAVAAFSEQLDRLCRRGWLLFYEKTADTPAAYGLLPVMAELARRKMPPTVEGCEDFISQMTSLLRTEKLGVAKDFLEYAQSVVSCAKNLDTAEVAYLAVWAGDTCRNLGKIPQASIFYQNYNAVCQKLAAKNPDAEIFQHELAVSFSKLGDLALAQGRQSEARSFFEKYNEIFQKLADRNPDSEGFQRNLAVSFSKLGGLVLAQDKHQEAHGFLVKANEIMQKIADKNPDSESLQRDLAVSFSWLGSLALAQGRQAEAQGFFEKDLEISQNLAAKNPDSESLQRNLAVSFSKLGDLALAQGKQAEAQGFFENRMKIFQNLAAKNPDSESLQRNLAVSFSKLGDLALAQGKQAEAQGFFEKYNEIMRGLAAKNPDSEDLQRDLAVSWIKLGDVENRLDEREKAVGYWRQALALFEARLAINPLSARLREDVENTRQRLGEESRES
jgi:tetratricopeptide (TPR) repeat protein